MEIKDIIILLAIVLIAAFLRDGKGSSKSSGSRSTSSRSVSHSTSRPRESYTSNNTQRQNSNQSYQNDGARNRGESSHPSDKPKGKSLRDRMARPKPSPEPMDTPTSIPNPTTGQQGRHLPTATNSLDEVMLVVRRFLSNDFNSSLSEEQYHTLYMLVKELKGTESILASERVKIIYYIVNMVQQKYWVAYKNGENLEDIWVKKYDRIIIPLQNFPKDIEYASYFENGQWVKRKKEFTQLQSPYIAFLSEEDRILRTILKLVDSEIIKATQNLKDNEFQSGQPTGGSHQILSEITYLTNIALFSILIDLVTGIENTAHSKGVHPDIVYQTLISLSEAKTRTEEQIDVRVYEKGYGLDLVIKSTEDSNTYYNCDLITSAIIEREYSKFVVLKDLEFFDTLALDGLSTISTTKKGKHIDLTTLKLEGMLKPSNHFNRRKNSTTIKEDEIPVIPENLYIDATHEIPTVKRVTVTRELTQTQLVVVHALNNYRVSEEKVKESFENYHSKLTMR